MTTAATDAADQSVAGARAGHAVVVGASMAGLLAARVLADHFDRVTLVERDQLPEGAVHRKGVPQGRQVHLLLARGREIVERLFPGYGEELRAAGAVPVRVPGDLLALGSGGWVDRRAPGWLALAASRPLMEATVRRRVRALPGVTVLDRTEATGLRASPDRREVRGVSLHGLADGRAVDLGADLVVDASGRGSRTPTWLETLGYPRPEQVRIEPDLVYANRLFRRPEKFPGDWKAVMVMPEPPSDARSGSLFPLEGGRWIASVMGAGDARPPADEEGFAEFVGRLRHPVLAETLVAAEPLTPVQTHRSTTNRRWYYERMRRWPERYVVLGDAVCAFNPVYGQGMTTAALAAEELDRCLAHHRRRHPAGDLAGLARRFQRRLARRNADAWLLSTQEDLRFPTTTGGRVGLLQRIQYRYFDRVGTACTWDPVSADAFIRVLGMLDRPRVLLRPRIMAAAAVSRPGGRGRSAPQAAPSPAGAAGPPHP